MRRTDLLAGLLFSGLGLGFAIGALDYRIGSPARMGSGFFPLVLAIGLVGVGLAVMLRGARGAGSELDWGPLAPLAVILAAIAGFALLLGPLGFVATSFVTVLVASFAGPPVSVAARLVQAATLAAASALIFIWGLGVPIPLWPDLLS